MEAQQLAEAIVQATAVTIDSTATPQCRAEAVQFFEQVGTVTRTLLNVNEALLGRPRSCCIVSAQHSLIYCHSKLLFRLSCSHLHGLSLM